MPVESAADAQASQIAWEVVVLPGDMGEVAVELRDTPFSGRPRGVRRRTLLDRIEGLSPSALMISGPTTVRIRLVRDAGAFIGEGQAALRRASGNCRFAPDPGYAQALADNGLGDLSPADHLSLAILDVRLELLAALERNGYRRPTAQGLIEAGAHGVDAAYVEAMKKLGLLTSELGDLIRLHDHGVAPSYLKELHSAGIHPSVSEATFLRDHRVDGAFAAGLRDLGFGELAVPALAHLRDLGVTLEFARREMGMQGASSTDELIRARIAELSWGPCHGVATG